MDRKSHSAETITPFKAAVASAMLTALLGFIPPALLGCSQEEKPPTQQQTEELRQKTLKKGKSFSQDARRASK